MKCFCFRELITKRLSFVLFWGGTFRLAGFMGGTACGCAEITIYRIIHISKAWALWGSHGLMAFCVVASYVRGCWHEDKEGATLCVRVTIFIEGCNERAEKPKTIKQARQTHMKKPFQFERTQFALKAASGDSLQNRPMLHCNAN